MKCVICGTELKGKQRKYCCKKCSYVGYLVKTQNPEKEKADMILKLYERFRRAFNKRSFRGCGGGFYARVFVAACVECKFTDTEIADVIKRERSTICFHRHRIKPKEVEIAKEFLFNKNYVYRSKYNNFSYRSKK